MKHRIARFMSPLLAVYLLLVTVGLPLEQVYCACVGQVRVQVLGMAAELDSCAHGTHDAEPLFACCAKMLAERAAADADVMSCHFGEAILLDNTQADSANCMTSEVVYAHFDADFVTADAIMDDGTSLQSAGVLVSTPIFSDAAAVAATYPVCDPSPPPVRASGWEMRIFHQSFLC